LPATAGSERIAAAALAAVAVPLQPPSAPDERRVRRRIQLGEPREQGRIDIRDRRGPLDRPLVRACAKLVGTGRVGGQEGLIGVPALEQVPVQRERHREVGPRPHGQVEIRLPRQRGRPGVDDDQARARLPGFTEVWDEVDTGGCRVDPPEYDQPGVGVVHVGDAGHLAVEGLVGRPGGCGADGAREPRGAEGPEQRGIGRVLRQQAVRSAVAERQDRVGARSIADRHHPLGDVVQRLVPVHPREDALPLGPLPDGGVEQTVLAVDAAGEPPDLVADESAGHRIAVAAVDGDQSALLDGHLERARIGAVERAGRSDGGPTPGVGLAGAGHPRIIACRS
jgi:hypothetical protein